MSLPALGPLTNLEVLTYGVDRLTEYRLRHDPQLASDVEVVLVELATRMSETLVLPTGGVGGSKIVRGAWGSYLYPGESVLGV